MVWDVTDPVNAKQIQYTRYGETAYFKSNTDTLKTFIAFIPSNAQLPVIKPEAIQNQDLHSSPATDMIIITHPLFSSYAKKLADIHLNNDCIISLIVTPQ